MPSSTWPGLANGTPAARCGRSFFWPSGMAMAALRTADAAVDQKTELVVTNDKLDKLFIEGESTGFQFATE